MLVIKKSLPMKQMYSLIKLSAITKYKLKQMGYILVFFVIVGFAGIVTNLQSNDFPLLRSIISVFILGSFTALFEIVISPKLLKYSFKINILITLGFYLIIFSSLIILMSYATLVYKENLSWSAALSRDFSTVVPDTMGLIIMLSVLSISILVLLRFSSMMLGEGVLRNYFSGKYHKPRKEERVFMFLDLKSSTEIAELLGHERYSNFLKDFFNKLDEAILESKGFLFQYVGDEIVMIWDYNEGLKKNNALKFYKLITKLLDDYKEEFEEEYGIIPEYKAGIHCGEVSITEIGSIRKSIAYHGDPINTASRICAKCKKLDTNLLISTSVYDRLNTNCEFNFKFLGECFLKGKKEKLGIYSMQVFQEKKAQILNVNNFELRKNISR